MSDDVDYLKEADALLLGGSAIEIHPSADVIHEVDGKLYAVPTEPWIKLSTAFRNKWLSKLKGSNLSVFLSIALHINDKGESYPSGETIARETGLSRREVSYAVQELKAMGLLYIRRGQGKNGTNLYTVMGMASYGDGNPTIITPTGGSAENAHPTSGGSAELSTLDVYTSAHEVEPLSRTIKTTRTKEILKGNQEALERGMANQKIPHLGEYPEDTRSILEKFCSLWKISLPTRKSADYGYWIKGARALDIACEGHPDVVLKEIKDDLTIRRRGYQVTIASPNSLINMARAKVGELKIKAEQDKPLIPPGAAELWVGGVKYER